MDWLRGRCAAKDAVRLLVKQRTGTELRAADIELVPDQWGRPCVEGPWKARLGLHPVVSLSHSGELAIALAAPSASALVGIDLESIARAGEGFDQLAFHRSERGLVQTVLPDRQREWSLRLWCAKEAVAKALGRGFQAGFKALEVTHLDESGTVYVELRDGLADAFPEFRDRRFRAHTCAGKGFVISTVVSNQDGGNERARLDGKNERSNTGVRAE
jgi:phosphopantetheinyl transferase